MKIIIPAYEPNHRLVEVVEGIVRDLPSSEVIVIDDGSGDDYKSYYDHAEQLGETLLRHSHNRGKGAALKTAFDYLLNNGCADQEDYLVTIDSDGQHLVSDMIKVAEAARGKHSHLILGSRSFVGEVPLRSRFGNIVTARLFRLVTGENISDTQTGLRAMSTRLLPWLLSLSGDRFEYEFNMLLEAKTSSILIEEVPIETIYIEENESSHFRPIHDSIRIYAPFLKFSSTAIIAAVIDASLLFILMNLTGHLLFSVVVARVLSATAQCCLNASLVFKSRTSKTFRVGIRYTLLVIILLICNYFLIQSLLGIGIGLVIAKLLTETFLFIVSYRVQKNMIFV